MNLTKYAIALSILAVSGNALAQSSGTLTYGPAAAVAGPTAGAVATPVPIPSLFLLPLGIAIAFFGYRAIRKNGMGSVLGALLVAMGLGVSVSSSLHIHKAIAAAMIELNQPGGGTVNIPVGDAIYTNTSGVALEIGTVVAPPACATTAPADECVSGLVLADTESCSTIYDCSQTISFTSTAPADATVGGSTYAVAATASSGLAVTFSTASAACSIAGSTVSFIAAGDCVIDADQAGDADYSAAPQVQQIVSVAVGGEPEVCDGVDNDLNTLIDDNLPSGVASGDYCTLGPDSGLVGAEQCGFQTCQGAAGYACVSGGSWYVANGQPASNCAGSDGNPRFEVSVTKKADGVEAASPTPGSFTLTRAGDTTNPLTVNYTLTGTASGIAGTPTADLGDDEDYTVLSLTQVDIPAGQASVDVEFTVLDDTVFDPDETVILSIGSGGYTVGASDTATANITAADKRIFVTASRYNGNLGGIDGADAKCEADANKPSGGGTFKAMLAGGARSAVPTSDWVLSPGASYFRTGGSDFIQRADSNALLPFPLRNSLREAPTNIVWTGLDINWTTIEGLTCMGWSDQRPFIFGVFGDSFRVDGESLARSLDDCSFEYKMYCVEQ